MVSLPRDYLLPFGGVVYKRQLLPLQVIALERSATNGKLLIHSQSLSVCRARDLLCYLSPLTLFPLLLSSPTLSFFSFSHLFGARLHCVTQSVLYFMILHLQCFQFLD